ARLLAGAFRIRHSRQRRSVRAHAGAAGRLRAGTVVHRAAAGRVHAHGRAGTPGTRGVAGAVLGDRRDGLRRLPGPGVLAAPVGELPDRAGAAERGFGGLHPVPAADRRGRPGHAVVDGVLLVDPAPARAATAAIAQWRA